MCLPQCMVLHIPVCDVMWCLFVELEWSLPLPYKDLRDPLLSGMFVTPETRQHVCNMDTVSQTAHKHQCGVSLILVWCRSAECHTIAFSDIEY